MSEFGGISIGCNFFRRPRSIGKVYVFLDNIIIIGISSLQYRFFSALLSFCLYLSRPESELTYDGHDPILINPNTIVLSIEIDYTQNRTRLSTHRSMKTTILSVSQQRSPASRIGTTECSEGENNDLSVAKKCQRARADLHQ